jgi:transglutaminase-like putative cysteine protease
VIAFGRRLGIVLSLAGVVFLAGASLDRVYNGQLLLLLVADAALASVLLPLLLRRAPAFVVAPLSLLLLAAYSVYCVQISAKAGGINGGLRDLTIDAARNALPRLLTALIPVEPQPDTVLAPVVLAWLAGLAAAELAVRANRVAVACIGPVLLYAGALVLVGPNAPVQLWQPIAVAALVAAAMALGRPVSDTEHRARRSRGSAGITASERTVLRTRAAFSLAAVIAIMLAVVAVIAPVVAGGVGISPGDPRALVHPPDLDAADENPLIRISGWAADPTQKLFKVTVVHGAPPPTAKPTPTAANQPINGTAQPTTAPPDDAPVGAYDTRLRLAVLEEWDGVTWHTSSDYRGAGRVLPPLAVPADWTGHTDAPSLDIDETITVDQLEGRLLPAVPTPSRVDGVRVSFDRASGTMIQDERLSPGLTYTVSSVNSAVDINLLPAADVPSGAAAAHLLAVGDEVPPDLSHLAEVVSAGQASPYNRALALQDFLAEHFRYATDAPSGHAYPNLRFFLFGDPRAGGQRGTSEQFAAAFAALGRLMGLPTRVVVGFHTPAGGGVITASDGVAWPEVLFTDVGWVAFDPLPQPNTPPQPLEDQFLPQPTPPTQPPASVPPITSSASAEPSVSPSSSGPAAGGLSAGVVAGGIGGGVLMLALATALVLAFLRAALRRRRLDQGSPPDKVIGAWDEVLDTLLLAGQPPPPHLAASGVADHAARVATTERAGRHSSRPRPPVPPLDELAERVNTVGFGTPSSTMDEMAAHSARVVALDYARAIRARRPWWRRLLWSVDPRPLRRRR